MQPTENVQERLKELTLIYAQAKEIILRAEELDPSFRSNVMVIKELRDSNDHLMRLFSEWILNGAKNEKYMLAQIDKARGHVFRAGYDAIDGLVVGYKVRVADAMNKISNGAISDVFPEYYTSAAEADILSDKIASHRNDKDVADDTLTNLESYAQDAAKVAEFCKKTISRVPLMTAWDKKERRNVFLKDIFIVILAGAVVAIVEAYALVYFEHRESAKQSEAIPQATNSVSKPH